MGPSMSILRVPEPKTAKNRLHLDLLASGGRHVDPEVRRERIVATVGILTDIGATVIAEMVRSGQFDHVVLADPEGNEFCVV